MGDHKEQEGILKGDMSEVGNIERNIARRFHRACLLSESEGVSISNSGAQAEPWFKLAKAENVGRIIF
jgi:hypothetical protein